MGHAPPGGAGVPPHLLQLRPSVLAVSPHQPPGVGRLGPGRVAMDADSRPALGIIFSSMRTCAAGVDRHLSLAARFRNGLVSAPCACCTCSCPCCCNRTPTGIPDGLSCKELMKKTSARMF